MPNPVTTRPTPPNPVTEAAETALRAALPEAAFRPVGPRYLEEPRGRYSGPGGLVLAPGSTAEVAAAVRIAAAHRIAVIPFGGGTGLVGGQIAPDLPRPLILSLERMTAIRAIHPAENVLVAEAGAILADVQQAAAGAGRLFPLSLASEGSARIGGLLSTNAGGLNVLRYGNARDLTLGIEAVMPDGRVLHGLKRLRKDNTGYDLRHLMIGAEGTLGLITAAALRLFPRPQAIGTACLVVPGPQAALDLLALARDRLGDGLQAFELIAGQGLAFLAQTLPQVRQPFASPPDWSVLIELGLFGQSDAEAELSALLDQAMEAGLVLDGVIAQSETQRQALWQVRENLPEANRRIGAVSNHDISLPLGAVPDFIARAPAVLAPIGDFRINCFGHLGDGNLHYNVFPQPGQTRADHENARGTIKRALHDLVHALEGSVSAEHGIGRLKVEDLERYSDPVRLDLLHRIKAALDPDGIMNPGAVLAPRGNPVS